MNLQKLMWAAAAASLVAGAALADPVRTIFTMENKFPEAMGWEVELGGSGATYDGSRAVARFDSYAGYLGARFGATDRLALRAAVPYVYYSTGGRREDGFGDVSLGAEFLFFEDIFEYAWIVPHATAMFPTGDEDKGLGSGDVQGIFGVSVGTTTMDVLHWAADVSYATDASTAKEDKGLVTGSASLVWELDKQASVLGEVQFRNDPANTDKDYALMYHAGLAYRINANWSAMGYGGAASRMNLDYYGMARLVYQF